MGSKFTVVSCVLLDYDPFATVVFANNPWSLVDEHKLS
jgi:hypothetical protein